MPPQLSTSSRPSSYWSDLKAVVSPWSSPPNTTRPQLLRSVVLRSVRIRIATTSGPRGSTSSSIPLPLKVRPALIVLNILDLIVLGLLGFHPKSSTWLPFNDKVLHFFCFFFATALFYAIWDIDSTTRRSSPHFWRPMPLFLCVFVCFFVGGIGSEVVQSLLPYKQFDIWDVVANLLGSSLGLWVSYWAEKRVRLDREVRSLYMPLDPEAYGDDLDGQYGEGDGEDQGRDDDEDDARDRRQAAYFYDVDREEEARRKARSTERGVDSKGNESGRSVRDQGRAGSSDTRHNDLFSIDDGDDDDGGGDDDGRQSTSIAPPASDEASAWRTEFEAAS